MARGCQPLSQSNEGGQGRAVGALYGQGEPSQTSYTTESSHRGTARQETPRPTDIRVLGQLQRMLAGDAQDEGEALTCLNMDAPAPPPRLGCGTPWPARERSRCLGPAPWACRRSRNS